MQYNEAVSKLEERAQWIEGLENTVRYTYSTQQSDTLEYVTSSTKRVIGIFGILALITAVIAAVGIVLDSIWIFSICLCACVYTLGVVVFFAFGMKKAKKREYIPGEVSLCFNAYGISMRVCNERISSVYAYEWNDFEQITEYKKVTVGIKEGIAYIFPKRVFSADEYELFRKMSFASAGKKCFYKNFRPNNNNQ